MTRNATLTVNPQASGDTVAIQRAEYDDRDEDLRVEATSTSATATLQVFVTSTNQLIGTLTNNGGGRYSRTFTRSTNPQNIIVRSSLGGAASKNVKCVLWDSESDRPAGISIGQPGRPGRVFLRY